MARVAPAGAIERLAAYTSPSAPALRKLRALAPGHPAPPRLFASDVSQLTVPAYPGELSNRPYILPCLPLLTA